MKALLLGALALSISTAAMAQPAPAAPAEEDIVESPVWLPKAKFDGSPFPAKALEAGKSGSAGIICTVTATERVENCVIDFEDPEGYDFGKALLAYAKVLRVKKTDANGVSIVGKKVEYVLEFKNPNK